jgi:hypothetical protein
VAVTQKFLNKKASEAFGEIEEGVKDSKDVVKETAQRIRRMQGLPGGGEVFRGVGPGKKLGGNGKWSFTLDRGWQPV